MPSSIHISQARAILDRHQPVDLTVVRRNGSLLNAIGVVPLKYDFYSGTRTIKFPESGQIRKIYDVCILAINGFDVYI